MQAIPREKKPKPAPLKTIQLPEVAMLKFELLNLKMGMLKERMQPLVAQQAALAKSVGEELGVDLKDYSMDLSTGEGTLTEPK